MTPRERAKKIIDSVAVRLSLADQDVLRDKIEQAIIADRQALQSEIVDKLRRLQDCQNYSSDFRKALDAGVYNSICEIQSVFAQQSQPEQLKPDEIKVEATGTFKPSGRIVTINGSMLITEAESDRRVLAEREACAKIATNRYAFNLASEIRARSNQPEEKPEKETCMAGSFDPGCSTCIREAKEEAEENAEENAKNECAEVLGRAWGYFDQSKEKKVEAFIFGQKFVPESDQSTRIATLHEWQAKDAQTIQQLNVSNNALSLKVAQLEKEKHGLTEKLKISTYCFIGRSAGLPCGDPGCDNCPAS